MAHEIYHVHFDVEKIIAHFGGISNAILALHKIGMDAKPKTLQKQRERNYMSSDMIASLALASVRIGRPINLFQCLKHKEEETCESSPSSPPPSS